MKICLISMEWPKVGGGIGTYMYILAQGLVSSGHTVIVITHDEEPIPIEGVELHQIAIPEVRIRFMNRVKKWQMEPFDSWSSYAFRHFEQKKIFERVDVIESAEYGAWARKFINRKVPIITRCHTSTQIVWSTNSSESASSNKSPLWIKFQDAKERKQVVLSNGITSPSHSLANYLSMHWQIPRRRFKIIPNPINTKLFCPKMDNFSVQTEDFKREILFVGRLDFNKGCFDLAYAMLPIFEKYKDVTLRFVGLDRNAPSTFLSMGKTSTEVIKKLVPQKYHDRLLFTSHIPVTEVIKYQQNAYCSVMPTNGFESFSYTVLEPMSCGTATIATHCGGPSEIITNCRDGLLVNPGDIDELTEAIASLLNDLKYRNLISENARKTALKSFSFEIIIPKLIAYYEQIIAKNSDFNGC